MRRTGRYWWLTVLSSLGTVVASLLITLWNPSTWWADLWLDIVPQGLGMASVITTTLIVSIRKTLSRVGHS